MNALATFDFEEQAVRTVMIDDEPWFVGRDICRCLEIKNNRDALARLDEDEKRDGVGIADTIGRQQLTALVSEPGVYRLVFTSRTKIAERFKRWLAHEVLPALRRGGAYAMVNVPRGPDIEDRRDWSSEISLCYRVFGRAAARSMWRASPLWQPPEAEMVSFGGFGSVGDFVGAVVVQSPGSRIAARDLYAAYRTWCERNGAGCVTETAFGRELTANGFVKTKRGRNWYEGVALG